MTVFLHVKPSVKEGEHVAAGLAANGQLLFGEHLGAACGEAVDRLCIRTGLASDCLIGRVVNVVGVFNSASAVQAACYCADVCRAGNVSVVRAVGDSAAVYICGDTADIIYARNVNCVPRVCDLCTIEICGYTGGIGLAVQRALNAQVLYLGSRAAYIAEKSLVIFLRIDCELQNGIAAAVKHALEGGADCTADRSPGDIFKLYIGGKVEGDAFCQLACVDVFGK